MLAVVSVAPEDQGAGVVSLASTTWIPGFEQHLAPAGSGGAYTDETHPKLVWHTSESAPGTIDGVIAEMMTKQHTDVYHCIVDTKLRRRAQILPLNVSASALAHPPAAETNHDGAIQVCIVGRAHDMPTLSASDLQWLGSQVLAPIMQCVPELHVDIAAAFYGDDAGFTIATAFNPPARQRMSASTWLAFNGQCGHQHVPGNDHWDPGKLDVATITAAAHSVLHPVPPPVKVKPMYDPPFAKGLGIAAVWKNSDGSVKAMVAPNGDVYAFSVPYRQWPTQATDFGGRQAAQIGQAPGLPAGRYVITATSGETYTP